MGASQLLLITAMLSTTPLGACKHSTEHSVVLAHSVRQSCDILSVVAEFALKTVSVAATVHCCCYCALLLLLCTVVLSQVVQSGAQAHPAVLGRLQPQLRVDSQSERCAPPAAC